MEIDQVLSTQYHIHNSKLVPVPPGWSALAYRVESGGNFYFLKVYDKIRFTAQAWIQEIDHYLPTLVWLGEQSPLHNRVPHVISTEHGAYRYEDSRWIY